MDNVGKRILTYFKDFAVLTAQNFKSMFSLSTLCINKRIKVLFSCLLFLSPLAFIKSGICYRS